VRQTGTPTSRPTTRGNAPEALLRALRITVRRRIEGLLAGEHRAAALGIGTELALVRPYVPGDDDVRQIDWMVSARTGEPHVRVQIAERVLVTWVALDVSPSMRFGTADRRKADVAEGVAMALGHLGTRHAGRLGMVTFGGEAPKALPPRQGRNGQLGLIRALREESPPDGVGVASLGAAMSHLARVARSRAFVAIVSDFRGPLDWRLPLLRLAGRHDVVALEIRDRRELELPDVGEIWVTDPESGVQLRVDTRDRRLRERFKTAAAAERAEVATLLRSSGVDHLVLHTAGDWLRELAGFLRLRTERRHGMHLAGRGLAGAGAASAMAGGPGPHRAGGRP
jgi:uncharacterized protein (DUF58 family)